ncbi:serine protease grass-like [Topomyia yanbarensis]|uniref:serine protease grass-like n=1 Tax=Topomyia yanbarensis TaxID=2498891 RepID=UPI00273C217B|nr:serine protease grass-like [Topomyia yanbarensis]
MAILQNKDSDYLCPGTLINKRYILTVAHCIRNDLPKKVLLGEHTIGQATDCNENEDCAPPVRQYRIECITTHPDFAIRKQQHDIALIRLSEEVTFDDHIQPICLPYTADLRRHEPSRFIITGWGRTGAFEDSSHTLLKATIFPANRTLCQQWLSGSPKGFALNDGQICAGGREPNLANTCAGDGGGPLGYGAQLYGTRFVQFGISSLRVACGTTAPAIYTNISYYMDWISANLKP